MDRSALVRIAEPRVTFESLMASLRPTAVQAGLADGRVLNAFIIESDGERITAINSVVNPDKLDHLGEVADYASILREARGR